MSDPRSRALLLAATDISEAFIAAVTEVRPPEEADELLTAYCRDNGADNGASGLAALAALMLLLWSEASDRSVDDLLATVRTRLNGGAPPSGVREPRRPAPTTGGGQATR